MNTGFTQSTIEQPTAQIDSLDAARTLFQRTKGTPGSDRYISQSLETLHTSSPFCALKALDSILRTDASIRPQNFVDKTVFKHKPTQDFIDKLQHLSVFISETYGLHVANKVSCFSIMDTLADTLKADTARLEHILRASDDTLSHYLSENYDIKVLLHKRRVLNAATSISRSILALKSTALLIDQLLHKRDLINAIAIFYLADVAMRTSKTVLVDVEAMRSGLKRDHERLSYQLKHQIMALLYGKGTTTGSFYTVTNLTGSPAATTKQGSPSINGTIGTLSSSSQSGQDTDVLSSIPCISNSYSLGLYRMIQNLPFLPLCTFLRSVAARSYQTTDLIQTFIDSLGVLKSFALERNPFFNVTPSQEAVIRNSTIDTMPPELYGVLLGQCFLMLYESDIAAGRISDISDFLRGLLVENMDSRLIEMYHRAEQESNFIDEGQHSTLSTDKMFYISSSLDLHRADHILKLRRLILNPSGGVHVPEFRLVDTTSLKDFAKVTRRFFQRAYFSMINVTLLYGSFLVSYNCYLQALKQPSPFDHQQSPPAGLSIAKTLQPSKSRAILQPTTFNIGAMTSISSMPVMPPHPPMQSPNSSAQPEHISFKKILENLFFMLAETHPSSALEFLDADVDSSPSGGFSDANMFMSSFSASSNQKRIISASFSSTTSAGKLISIKANEQLPFINTIFVLDAKYPFIGCDDGLKRFLGAFYDAAIRRLAYYCSMVIKSSGYTKSSTQIYQQMHGDKLTIGGHDGMYTAMGASASEQDGRILTDTATSSLFSLSWVRSLSLYSSSPGASKALSSVKPNNWNTLLIENHLLSFYYCAVMLTDVVEINPIDEIFTQFFSRLLDNYTSYINANANNLFALVSLQDLELGLYTANSRVYGLRVLSSLTSLQQPDDDVSCYSTCEAPSELTDALTSTTGLLRVDSSYSLARALLGDERIVRSDKPEFNAYKLAQYTLRFLNDMMAFSSMSSKYYEANSALILSTICNTFLNMIYMRLHVHYKALYSYTLFFTPAGNSPIEGSTVSSYEALLDDYIGSVTITSDRIASLDKALGQHGIEQYASVSSFYSLGTFAILDELIDTRQTTDGTSIFAGVGRSTPGSSAISKRSSAAHSFTLNPIAASFRQSRAMEGYEKSAKTRAHSRQSSGLQIFDAEAERASLNFALDGHNEGIGEDLKEPEQAPVRYSQNQFEGDALLEKLPTVVLVDGGMLEHALYCLQGCILVYDYLKKFTPVPPSSDHIWYSRFELTIQKIVHFIILEWRLYVSVHIRQGFDEDLNAPPEHVQLGAQCSVSAGYNSFVSSIKALRIMSERPDFKWIMNYDTLLFDHIFYTVERIFMERLDRVSSSVLRNDQMTRMMAALQYLSTVTTGPMSFRPVFQKLHSLCAG
ncbi:Hypothetical protein GLP15_473 [Giardia lamblia P15]|uniref:Uncharacterized protein n=1 Tax=Giardia intestinalis (strain P15) TaxID=658858 RepID=E1F6H5_GIAIA|nr:Hypothetical protein GLP15_473 [Giardia lamblia P15]